METITIKDIAKLCGVGVSTVSRAMNNHPDINEETKQKIMEVIKDYHYVPNNSARNLKRADAKAIAVLIKGITNPFFSKMIKVFEQEIQEKKYTFVLQHVDDHQDEVAERNCIFGRSLFPLPGEAGADSSTFCTQHHWTEGSVRK